MNSAFSESALSLTVQQLEKRIGDGTDSLASVLRLPLTEDQRILWENALEIFRRRWSTATRRELQRLNSTQGLYSAMGEEPTAQTRWALSRMVMP